METKYESITTPTATPYGASDLNESQGFLTPPKTPRRRISNWVKIGVPVLIVVILAAVLGGVLGSRHSSSNSSSSQAAAASSAASVQQDIGIFPVATDSLYLLPIYPSTTNPAAFTTPTFISSSSASSLAWPQDSFQPQNPSPTSVRPDRPRLIAPSYKWAALPQLIKNDPYLESWNASIFNNASQYYSEPAVVYNLDGSNGILDNAREIKMRVKAFSYVYRMTNNTQWVNRTWEELQNAAGNSSQYFGPNDSTRWNPSHFLDTAEMIAAYAIAYDWLYDQWTAAQKESIMWTMTFYGLSNGIIAYSDTNDPLYYGWWRNNTEGNWNCVCNNGLIMGSLAILGDDTTGIAAQLLSMTIPNANENCALAVSNDGTWAETANYWYFGTTAHAEMSSSLLTATGSNYGLLSTNPNFNLAGLYHMYVSGPGSLFGYGDCGPNKYSTTANAMMFYAQQYNQPQYALFQRDQFDAPEPWSMFWYDATAFGAFWDGLPLDHFFDNSTDQWGSMRSSWTDENALYVAIKAGTLQNHQTHNDLDCGDFVLDARGTRWAGELGSGDYNSPGYFSNDTQISERWLYYRKMTEGQNTVLIGQTNQNVLAAPTITFNSSGTVQGSSTVFQVPGGSTAYFITDMTSAYFETTSLKRGIRMINNRTQVLLQDEINAQASVMWRMHTNATVTINSATSATLQIGSETMLVQMLNPPSGAQFSQMLAQRFATDPTPPVPDQPNTGVTVLCISLPAGSYTLEVLFNPQWPGMSSTAYVTPSSVPLSQWSLTSHP